MWLSRTLGSDAGSTPRAVLDFLRLSFCQALSPIRSKPRQSFDISTTRRDHAVLFSHHLRHALPRPASPPPSRCPQGELFVLSSLSRLRYNQRPPGIRSCMPPIPRALLLITSTPLPPPTMLFTSPHCVPPHLPLDYPMTAPRWVTRTRTG